MERKIKDSSIIAENYDNKSNVVLETRAVTLL